MLNRLSLFLGASLLSWSAWGADAITNTVINASPDNYTVVLTSLSDGTGESAAVKVDLSGLTGATAIAVKNVQWVSQGFTYFTLAWDHTADDVAAQIPNGDGEIDFTGGISHIGLVDPDSAGGTGDLVLTTVGHDAGDSYTMVLTLKIVY